MTGTLYGWIVGRKTAWRMPAHIMRPDRKKTYCQLENNTSARLQTGHTPPKNKRICRNCEQLSARPRIQDCGTFVTVTRKDREPRTIGKKYPYFQHALNEATGP